MDDYFDRVETQLGALIQKGAHRRPRVPTTLRVPRIPLGTLALAGTTALALAVATILLVSVHGREPSPRGGAGVNAGEIDPSLVNNFQILQRPLTPADHLPAGFAEGGLGGVARGLFQRSSTWLTSQPGPPSVASIGLLPALTQRTTIPGTGYSAWLIPGRHGMCWFSASGPFPSQSVTLPYSAICVGPLEHPATALIDGSWPDVEGGNQRIVGLVTDRVLAVMLVDGSGHRQRVPLSDGFYVSPIPSGSERLVAITRSGTEPLYPQPWTGPKLPRIVGSAAKVIARSSRPEVVLTGTRGMHVRLMSEMTCTTPGRAAGGDSGVAKGYAHQAAYQVPAVLPIGFPKQSSSLPACDLAVMVSAAGRTRGTVRVAIADR